MVVHRKRLRVVLLGLLRKLVRLLLMLLRGWDIGLLRRIPVGLRRRRVLGLRLWGIGLRRRRRRYRDCVRLRGIKVRGSRGG